MSCIAPRGAHAVIPSRPSPTSSSFLSGAPLDARKPSHRRNWPAAHTHLPRKWALSAIAEPPSQEEQDVQDQVEPFASETGGRRGHYVQPSSQISRGLNIEQRLSDASSWQEVEATVEDMFPRMNNTVPLLSMALRRVVQLLPSSRATTRVEGTGREGEEEEAVEEEAEQGKDTTSVPPLDSGLSSFINATMLHLEAALDSPEPLFNPKHSAAALLALDKLMGYRRHLLGVQPLAQQLLTQLAAAGDELTAFQLWAALHGACRMELQVGEEAAQQLLSASRRLVGSMTEGQLTTLCQASDLLRAEKVEIWGLVLERVEGLENAGFLLQRQLRLLKKPQLQWYQLYPKATTAVWGSAATTGRIFGAARWQEVAEVLKEVEGSDLNGTEAAAVFGAALCTLSQLLVGQGGRAAGAAQPAGAPGEEGEGEARDEQQQAPATQSTVPPAELTDPELSALLTSVSTQLLAALKSPTFTSIPTSRVSTSLAAIKHLANTISIPPAEALAQELLSLLASSETLLPTSLNTALNCIRDRQMKLPEEVTVKLAEHAWKLVPEMRMGLLIVSTKAVREGLLTKNWEEWKERVEERVTVLEKEQGKKDGGGKPNFKPLYLLLKGAEPVETRLQSCSSWQEVHSLYTQLSQQEGINLLKLTAMVLRRLAFIINNPGSEGVEPPQSAEDGEAGVRGGPEGEREQGESTDQAAPSADPPAPLDPTLSSFLHSLIAHIDTLCSPPNPALRANEASNALLALPTPSPTFPAATIRPLGLKLVQHVVAGASPPSTASLTHSLYAIVRLRLSLPEETAEKLLAQCWGEVGNLSALGLTRLCEGIGAGWVPCDDKEGWAKAVLEKVDALERHAKAKKTTKQAQKTSRQEAALLVGALQKLMQQPRLSWYRQYQSTARVWGPAHLFIASRLKPLLAATPAASAAQSPPFNSPDCCTALRLLDQRRMALEAQQQPSAPAPTFTSAAEVGSSSSTSGRKKALGSSKKARAALREQAGVLVGLVAKDLEGCGAWELGQALAAAARLGVKPDEETADCIVTSAVSRVGSRGDAISVVAAVGQMGYFPGEVEMEALLTTALEGPAPISTKDATNLLLSCLTVLYTVPQHLMASLLDQVTHTLPATTPSQLVRFLTGLSNAQPSPSPQLDGAMDVVLTQLDLKYPDLSPAEQGRTLAALQKLGFEVPEPEAPSQQGQ